MLPHRTLIGVALISAALLMTELSLTRIFSVTMYYHFAFMAISIALFGLSASDMDFVTPVVAIVAGLLMVSRFRYFSFKAGPKSDRVPFIWIPIAMLILVALAVDTPRVMLAIAVLYVLSGPIMTLWGLRQKRSSRRLQRGGARGDAPP